MYSDPETGASGRPGRRVHQACVSRARARRVAHPSVAGRSAAQNARCETTSARRGGRSGRCMCARAVGTPPGAARKAAAASHMPYVAAAAHGATPAVRRCPTASCALRPRFRRLCELANDPAQRPARDSPTERTSLLGRCRRGRRAVGRLGIAIAACPGSTVEEPSEGRQREHDEDCGKRAEPAECRVVVIHGRKSTRWRGQLGGVPGASPRPAPKMRKSAKAVRRRAAHKAAICGVLVL